MSGPTASGAIRRRAARVLLLDEADRLLLFRGFDPGDPDESPFWFTVGGAVDPGESVPEGELAERLPAVLAGVVPDPPLELFR